MQFIKKIDWFALYLNTMVILHIALFISSFFTGQEIDGWFSVQFTICIVGICLYERIKVAQNINLHFDNDTTSKEVIAAIKAVISGKVK
jgi:hypothetical protein